MITDQIYMCDFDGYRWHGARQKTLLFPCYKLFDKGADNTVNMIDLKLVREIKRPKNGTSRGFLDKQKFAIGGYLLAAN